MIEASAAFSSDKGDLDALMQPDLSRQAQADGDDAPEHAGDQDSYTGRGMGRFFVWGEPEEGCCVAPEVYTTPKFNGLIPKK